MHGRHHNVGYLAQRTVHAEAARLGTCMPSKHAVLQRHFDSLPSLVCQRCRMLDQGQTHIETASCGTATHAAPELLLGGRLTRSSDVYAFGIIAWEMVAGEEAFSGLSSIQVIAKLSCCTLHRPEIPAHCPPQLAALIERCWSANPLARCVLARTLQLPTCTPAAAQ